MPPLPLAPTWGGTSPKRTSRSSSFHPAPSSTPATTTIAGNCRNTVGFYPYFLELVSAIPATKSCDLGISLDWRFGDFSIAGIVLDTHALLTRVAACGPLLRRSLGPKIILMSSQAWQYARIGIWLLFDH
ncbi:hypothetical protein L3X38_025633 [Prunus dulcis]|uniref:Uncharacterized protein n=1 Tax=Prunus dulcis TaxID=3755 RepID=A0AAD4Z784_PRUDU|nr:hypothetical protein L3X38_025633 [Prunus dulcis]